MPEFGWYFEDCIIGGRSACSLVARGRNAFAAAVPGKLVLEIAGIAPAPGRALTPCDIGEQNWKHLQHYSYPR